MRSRGKTGMTGRTRLTLFNPLWKSELKARRPLCLNISRLDLTCRSTKKVLFLPQKCKRKQFQQRYTELFPSLLTILLRLLTCRKNVRSGVFLGTIGTLPVLLRITARTQKYSTTTTTKNRLQSGSCLLTTFLNIIKCRKPTYLLTRKDG